jgi:VanZ family protein
VIAYLLLTAAATEVLQVFAVTRTAGLADGLWNGVGIAGGFAAYLVLRTAYRRILARPNSVYTNE